MDSFVFDYIIEGYVDVQIVVNETDSSITIDSTQITIDSDQITMDQV